MGILKALDSLDDLMVRVELNDCEVYDTLVELAEDKIRDFVKKEHGIEFKKMYANQWCITGVNPWSDKEDLSDFDGIDIHFATDPEHFGKGDVEDAKQFSRGLYMVYYLT